MAGEPLSPETQISNNPQVFKLVVLLSMHITTVVWPGTEPTWQPVEPVHVSHTYFHDVVEPSPYGMPILFLQHFRPNLNLFPNDTQYEVMEAPSVLLEHGHQAYIVGYGVVHLC